jgi:hypothetical protein
MQKLIRELIRLYLLPGAVPDGLEARFAGQAADAIELAGAGGLVRAIVIPFRKMRTGDEAAHWTLLCEVANALQAELAVLAQEFAGLLRAAYFPDVKSMAEPAPTLVALPPCLNMETGKWAAFIHPGMGASFADESGLEMAPPLSGQVAFLEGLQSIDAAQFDAALALLRQKYGAAPAAPVRAAASGAPAGLLLKDATLDDIVAFLHAKNIEPTFRHLISRN